MQRDREGQERVAVWEWVREKSRRGARKGTGRGEERG